MDMAKPALYKSLLADSDAVQQRISEMAAEIITNYAGQDPLFLCLLRGGAPFAVSLMLAITAQDPHFHPDLDYMTIKTYGSARTDQPPKLIMGLAPSTIVEGRPVILLDDTLDKGETAQFATQHLEAAGAASVALVVLVQKDRPRTVYQSATIYGFESAGDAWLTGMGLDDPGIAHEANRFAGYVAYANEE